MTKGAGILVNLQKTRYIAGYMAGYCLVLPFTLVVMLPKILARHVMMAHQNATVAYNLAHAEPTRGIVAEMADGTLRYVEDPFPISVD